MPVNWAPNADGFWDVTTNWSSNPALPGAADDVTIDVGGATVRTITFRSGAATINSLTSQENLALTGGTLALVLGTCGCLIAGLWFGTVLGESAAAKDKQKDGKPAPRRSFGDALQNAATTTAVRLWKWNRARTKKDEQQPH